MSILEFYLFLLSDISFFPQAFQMSNLIREYMEKIVETQEKHQIGMVNGNEVTVPIHLQ